jgi:hypothetical protein
MMPRGDGGNGCRNSLTRGPCSCFPITVDLTSVHKVSRASGAPAVPSSARCQIHNPMAPEVEAAVASGARVPLSEGD